MDNIETQALRAAVQQLGQDIANLVVQRNAAQIQAAQLEKRVAELTTPPANPSEV